MTDYISREETLKRLCKDVCNVSDCQCDEIRCEEWFVIHDIPAADVRTVVRGEWEEEDSASNRWSFRCSVCGKGGRGYKFNFCSNCGADMRGESDV